MIERETLARIASTFVAPMTSIRSRRVHRLILAQFVRFDMVIPARGSDGAVGLFGFGEREAAFCGTDGTGAGADILEWGRLYGAVLTITHDLLKDSLPVTGWSLAHPQLAAVGGSLSLDPAELMIPEREQATALLRRLTGRND